VGSNPTGPSIVRARRESRRTNASPPPLVLRSAERLAAPLARFGAGIVVARLEERRRRGDVLRRCRSAALPPSSTGAEEPAQAIADGHEGRQVGDDDDRDEEAGRGPEFDGGEGEAEEDEVVGEDGPARPAGEVEAAGGDEGEKGEAEEEGEEGGVRHDRSMIRGPQRGPRFGRRPLSPGATIDGVTAADSTRATPPGTPPSWREDVEAVAPTVLVIGGFLTAPSLYRGLRTRLLDRGAAAVEIAPIWTPDWLLASWRGFGPIVTRASRALLAAAETAARSPASRGAPLLVVGHSAGGIIARLLTAPEPFAGRPCRGAGRIGAIVTLGTPHVVRHDGGFGGQIAAHAVAFLDRVAPGAYFAPEVGYVAVGSRGLPGRRTGDLRTRIAWAVYQAVLAQPGLDVVDGDGVVPLAATRLAGATEVVLDGIRHSPFGVRPWYGSEEAVEVWWPAAVEAWRAALRARVARRRGELGPNATPDPTPDATTPATTTASPPASPADSTVPSTPPPTAR
jgi:hypothetical protein